MYPKGCQIEIKVIIRTPDNEIIEGVDLWEVVEDYPDETLLAKQYNGIEEVFRAFRYSEIYRKRETINEINTRICHEMYSN